MAAPLFSIVTPVYKTPADVLRVMLRSVADQTFTDWEHCLVDDGTADAVPHIRKILDEAAAADPRVRVEYRHENGGIVHASNDALAMARGEFIALLDHDDELEPHALERVAAAIAGADDVDYVYTDEDKIDEHGSCSAPFFKPDWSPERFRTQMYTCHLSALRRTLVEEVGGFHADFNGSQDWDLVLRVTEKARRIAHVPEVLYHWRMLVSSAASSPEAKPWAYEAGTRAIQAHCDRTGFEALAEQESPGHYHLVPRLTTQPLVSIVVPTGGQMRDVRGEHAVLVEQAVESIVKTSTYENVEILCVVDEKVPQAVLDRLLDLGGDRLRLVSCNRPFNFSERINFGALAARGEHLLVLNDDVEVVTPTWIERLIMYSQVPEIGAVGARLLFGDGRLQHAGIVVSQHQGPSHVYRGFPGSHPGYYGMLLSASNWQAVTGACLMTRRELFEKVGGLSTLFPLNYNDV
ncbi:MAG TPA: glycosyltransferase, partial [Acidimicrobiales bacterium]|nr:glycosyltransferase [Acidimicrobiales bacterium]